MTYIFAFLAGGAICAAGQLLLDMTKLTAPRVLVIFVVLGAVLQGLNLYEPFVGLVKNGATVPLPGFGYVLARGAMEGAQRGFLGALTGAVESTAAGIAAAIVFGYIVSLVFNPKSIR